VVLVRSPRRFTLPASAACIAVCAIVAALAAGSPGLWGALVGGAIVLAFFGSTPAVLGPVAKADPRLSLLFALVFFGTKVVALIALFVVLSRAAGQGGALDPESVSVTVIVTTLVWLAARILDSTRDRTPTYDLPADDRREPDSFDSP